MLTRAAGGTSCPTTRRTTTRIKVKATARRHDATTPASRRPFAKATSRRRVAKRPKRSMGPKATSCARPTKRARAAAKIERSALREPGHGVGQLAGVDGLGHVQVEA